jgi:hypothetical protein
MYYSILAKAEAAGLSRNEILRKATAEGTFDLKSKCTEVLDEGNVPESITNG